MKLIVASLLFSIVHNLWSCIVQILFAQLEMIQSRRKLQFRPGTFFSPKNQTKYICLLNPINRE